MAHLLIVDDDANTLASLSRAFRLAGHQATVCDNAARALDLIKTERFDMVLSDVVMPGKDGLALLEDLKALGGPVPWKDDRGSTRMNADRKTNANEGERLFYFLAFDEQRLVFGEHGIEGAVDKGDLDDMRAGKRERFLELALLEQCNAEIA